MWILLFINVITSLEKFPPMRRKCQIKQQFKWSLSFLNEQENDFLGMICVKSKQLFPSLCSLINICLLESRWSSNLKPSPVYSSKLYFFSRSKWIFPKPLFLHLLLHTLKLLRVHSLRLLLLHMWKQVRCPEATWCFSALSDGHGAVVDFTQDVMSLLQTASSSKPSLTNLI